MKADPWFAQGLRFRCQRCGACCTGAPGYVWLRDGDTAAIAGRFGMDAALFLSRFARRVDGEWSLREEADGRCVLFESGSGCRAYEERPRQCRTWPFWARIVATPDAWASEAADCPGMGQGDVFDCDEIRRLAAHPPSPRTEP